MANKPNLSPQRLLFIGISIVLAVVFFAANFSPVSRFFAN